MTMEKTLLSREVLKKNKWSTVECDLFDKYKVFCHFIDNRYYFILEQRSDSEFILSLQKGCVNTTRKIDELTGVANNDTEEKNLSRIDLEELYGWNKVDYNVYSKEINDRYYTLVYTDFDCDFIFLEKIKIVNTLEELNETIAIEHTKAE